MKPPTRPLSADPAGGAALVALPLLRSVIDTHAAEARDDMLSLTSVVSTVGCAPNRDEQDLKTSGIELAFGMSFAGLWCGTRAPEEDGQASRRENDQPVTFEAEFNPSQ